MAICTGHIMTCVFVIAISMLLEATGSQPGFTSVYPKYKFMFNVDDEGLHKREEESSSEGHVSGLYSYMDPNGNLRTIKYNSTPETGFLAYGDTGVFANSMGPQTLEASPSVLHRKMGQPSSADYVPGLYSYMITNGNLQSIKDISTTKTGLPENGSALLFANSLSYLTLKPAAGALQVEKDDILDKNLQEKFSGENTHVSRHFELPPAPYGTASTLHSEVDIVAPSLIDNSIDEAKENASSRTEITKQGAETSNHSSFDSVPYEPQDILGVVGENISDITTVESAIFNNAQLKREMQNIHKIEHAYLSQHYPLNIPLNIVPYFVYPMPHWMALHPHYRFVL